MTASTVFDTRFYPFYGRLHENRVYGGWCPGTVTDRTDYLQVGMGAMLSVCTVATQGENINNEKTTSCNYPQTVKPGTFMRKPALQRFDQQLLVMIREPQRVQFRGLQKRISKFASQCEVCKPCFSTLQLDPRSKSTLFKSYCSTLGSKEINVGKYKPYR